MIPNPRDAPPAHVSAGSVLQGTLVDAIAVETINVKHIFRLQFLIYDHLHPKPCSALSPHPICALFQHGRDRSGVECRIGPIALHLFPRHIMAIGLAVGLVEVLVGTVAGAWLYREEPA